MPKISVIVPVYKVEKYLNRCVDGILNQTFTDFELILVDDGSPDNCGKVCDEYAEKDSRIVVIHKENGGLSDARNKGIEWVLKNSDSEWITFIDSDDYVHLQYLELLYNSAIKNDVLISSCGCRRCHEDLNNSYKISNYDIDVGHADALLQKGYKWEEYNRSVAWGRLYKKSLWYKVKFPIGRYHEDEFITYKLLYQCEKIVVILLSLYYYYQNDKSIVHSELTPKRIKDKCDAMCSQIKFFYDNGYYITFNRILDGEISRYYSNLHKYGRNRYYKNVLNFQYKTILTIMKSCASKVSPEVCKKFSFKTRISKKIRQTFFFRAMTKIYRFVIKKNNV